MNYKKIYKDTFIEALGIDKNKFNENLKYQEIDEWDSIAHMSLMSGIEEKFSITLETDDIVDFGSFKKGIEILKKYKINL